MGTILDTGKVIFGRFIFLVIFPLKFPLKNKNSSEILGAKEMGLDRTPIEFQTFYFFHVWLDPPNVGIKPRDHPITLTPERTQPKKLCTANFSSGTLKTLINELLRLKNKIF